MGEHEDYDQMVLLLYKDRHRFASLMGQELSHEWSEAVPDMMKMRSNPAG